MINKEDVERLPSEIGVYIFKNKDEILYIGKSINIKARVKSHIENSGYDRKEKLIIDRSDRVDTIVINNEFDSLILESELIKKYHPKYNVIWRDGKSHLYIKVTIKDEYPKILLSRKENDGRSLYFGPFSSSRVVESLLADIRKIVPFCSERKLSTRPCFYSKIDLCRPCPGYIINQDVEEKHNLKKQYRKNIKRIIKILEGKVIDILNLFYKQLKVLIKSERYEEAIVLRNKIFRMERLIEHPTTNPDPILTREKIVDIFLDEMKKYYPKLTKVHRLECYDISNFGNDVQVGPMVVLTDGAVDKKEYRRFRIKKNLKSDFERLSQVIERRLKNNWPLPDLIVVDGGKPQVRVVLEVIMRARKEIPVLGIAKNPDRLVIGSDDLPTIRFPQTNKAFNIVRLIRDESHRFANKYQRRLRRKVLLV